MFFNLIVVFLLQANNVFGVTVEVTGEQGELLFTEDVDVKMPANVGEISVDVFEEFGVSYEGSVEGIIELFDVPQKSEIVSTSELKAYGWCFSIDGLIPETLTHETTVQNKNAKIKWFYGYAHYLAGEWIDQCLVAN